MNNVVIRQLGSDEAAKYHQLRLQALKDSPEVFSRSYDMTAQMSDELIAKNFRDKTVFGAFDGEKLVAKVGFKVDHSAKKNHIAHLFGLYVSPAYRGKGLGRRLMEATIEQVSNRNDLEILELKVYADNVAAVALYMSLGFEVFGTEKDAVKEGDKYIDEYYMQLKP